MFIFISVCDNSYKWYKQNNVTENILIGHIKDCLGDLSRRCHSPWDRVGGSVPRGTLEGAPRQAEATDHPLGCRGLQLTTTN